MAIVFQDGPQYCSQVRVIIHNEHMNHLLTPPFLRAACAPRLVGRRSWGDSARDLTPSRSPASSVQDRCQIAIMGNGRWAMGMGNRAEGHSAAANGWPR